MANPVWLAQDLSNEELAHNWTLSPNDIREIRVCRGGENQTRFAVQLCFVRQNGYFLDSYQSVSLKIVNHLCLQIDLSPVLFLADENRPATATSYRSRIIRYLGFASFDDKIGEQLSNHLREQATEGFQARELEEVSEQTLLKWKVLLPPATVLKRLISDAANYVQNDVFLLISRSLSEEVKQKLETFLETNNQRSELFYLKEYPPQANTKAILKYLERYHIVSNLTANGIDLAEVNPSIIRHLAFLGKKYDAWTLRRMPEEKRHAVLASFLFETERSLLDYLVAMHHQYLLEMNRQSKHAFEEKSARLRRGSADGMSLLMSAMRNILGQTEPVNTTLSDIFEIFQPESLEQALEDCEKWKKFEETGLVGELAARYTWFRRYFYTFAELPFEVETGSEYLLESLTIVRRLNREKISEIPFDAARRFIPNNWKKALYKENGTIDKRIWIIALGFAVRDALRSGTLYLPNSRHHQSFWNLVFNEKQWSEQRGNFFENSNLNVQSDKLFADLHTEFQTVFVNFRKTLPTNQFAVIKNGAIVLKNSDAVGESARTKQLRRVIEATLPRVRIEDLLLNIDSLVNFTDQLRPLGGIKEKTSGLRKTKLAALVAHGTNLGISAMGSSTETITVDMLQNVSRLYLSRSNLKTANARLVNFHHRLATSRIWGDGTHSSSDGQRFALQPSSLLASYYPRYFGYYDQAVTLYTHVSDQHSVFSTQVISCTPREALYVLDGLLENDTILRHREHYTDTHGSTEQLFGICYLLGFSFMPRLKDLADQQLYTLDKRSETGNLKSIFRQSINWNLVAEQYDGLLRVAASLQNKTAPAHIILQRLQSSPSDNIAKALTNLGRIIKTIYILRYLSDEPLRRKIQKQLNRGENRHALAKRLFFANGGEFRTGDYEEIMNKASCLSILSNTVTIWNTLEMEKIISRLRSGGEEILDQDLQPISPYIHQHVIPNGTYRFRDDNEDDNIALNTQE
jgi:TnpA family transposase